MLPLARRRCRGHLGRLPLRPGFGLIPRPGRRRRRRRLVSHFGDLESRMEKPLSDFTVLRGLSELAHLPLSQLAAFRVSERGNSLSFLHTYNTVQLAY